MRDKQIEEMARAINVADHEYCNGKCIGCEHKPMRIENCACVDIAIAKGLVNAGYRKSNEVARELFEEAIKLAKEIADNSKVIAELEENPIKRIEAKGEQIGALMVWKVLMELKKKYTEDTK